MIRLQEAIDAVIWLVSSEVPQAQYKLLVSVAVMVNSFNGPFKAIKSEHPIQAAEQKRLRVMMLLALPRPPVWVVLERLALVLVCQLVLGTVGAVIAALLLPDADLAVTLLRWLPPALLLGGAGLYATVRARVVVFGVMLVVLLWGVTMLCVDLLVPGQPVFYPLNLIQPFLWPVVPYLQPETLPMGDYWLNRLCVGAAGLVLMLLALWSLRDEERVLLGEQTIEERIRQR